MVGIQRDTIIGQHRIVFTGFFLVYFRGYGEIRDKRYLISPYPLAALLVRATDTGWNCEDSVSSEMNGVIVTSTIYDYLTDIT